MTGHSAADAGHPAADDSRLSLVAAQLVTVFEQLGAEHKALVAEAEKTSVKERRGTVHRMVECIVQAGRTLNVTVTALATVHGLRVLGIDRQFSKDADGCDYSPLGTLGYPGETLYEAADLLEAVARALGQAYTPTRKYPGLAARARCPQQMGAALAGLRAALDLLCADLAAGHDEDAVTEYAATLKFLSELEERVCRTVPAQSTGLTADEVAAAIRADPDIARAAAAALKTATA
ncbi:hypothetical protein AB0B15_24495 [Streptomyces sp. NPDC045456]|uniref:hypothetical protein n=1 Tax=Streptomyces sp. NPDC045456 TaxID=3155254 RepID=UPI0034036039